MIYSVYRPEHKRYDYYDDGRASADFPNPKHLAGGKVASENAGYPLPGGSRRVGSGENPRGQIARLGDSDGGSSSSILTVLGVGLLGYGLWRLIKR
jgi:hypothetical protein